MAKSIDEFFRKVYGLPAWNAQLGYGTFLTFEFGQPHIQIREPRRPRKQVSERVRRLLGRRIVVVHGDWHLWIYCCDWSIYRRRTLIAHSGQSREKAALALRELDGQRLMRVRANPRTAETEFVFDLGGRLRTKVYGEDPTLEQWMFFAPNGRVLTLRASGEYSYSSATAKTSKEV